MSIPLNFLKIIKLFIILLVLFSLIGSFGTVHWTFALTAHFKMQYLILSLCCMLTFLWARLWWWVLLSCLGVMLNTIVVLPWYFQNTLVTPQSHHSHHLKLLLSNVNFKNKRYALLIQLIATEKPDIVIIPEGNKHWIQQLVKIFPYFITPPKSHYFGTSIFSHLPFEETQILQLGSQVRESLHIKIKTQGKIISLLTTHPLPPIRQNLFDKRNHQLLAVKSFLQSLSEPKILIGDLNISMWSPFYTKLLENTGLVNARQGFGLLPTWPTFLPIFMIPIDHCLVSPDITVVHIKKGQSIGSDHLPLIVELAI